MKTQAPFRNLAELVAQRAGDTPDLDILTFEHHGETQIRSYRQLWDNAQRLAAALKDLGVKKGDRILLLMHNHPEFVEAMVSSAILGAVFVPVDPRIGGSKLAHMLHDSKPCGAICTPYALPGLYEVSRQTAGIDWMLVDGADGEGSAGVALQCLGDVLAAPAPVPALPIAAGSEADPMQIMYTSGTTGDPKGIVIPHARFCTVAGHGQTVFGYRPEDRPYTGLSLTHGNAQFVTLAPSLNMGLPAVISSRFTKSRLWSIVRSHACTTFSMLGGMATSIHAEPPRPDDADNPVRLVISAGMPAAIWEDFERRFGVRIFEFYGAMEGGMTFKRVGEGPIGSCGRAAPGLLAKIVGADGCEVPPGMRGELCFRLSDGPFPPVTYLNNPQASAAKVVDGWLRSGDIVRRDEQGWIFYEFRKGGGLRRNGEFINPGLVEKTLAEHPAVDDVFVYGLPSKNAAPGESDLVAAVVPAGDLDVQVLFAWARARLVANFVPTFIQIVSEIPKTASEKPRRHRLVELFKSDPETIHIFRGA